MTKRRRQHTGDYPRVERSVDFVGLGTCVGMYRFEIGN
jgi:hypothetical protein